VPAGERSRPGKVDQEGSGTNPAAVPGGPPALVRN
jgi:hypothetical protein